MAIEVLTPITVVPKVQRSLRTSCQQRAAVQLGAGLAGVAQHFNLGQAFGVRPVSYTHLTLPTKA